MWLSIRNKIHFSIYILFVFNANGLFGQSDILSVPDHQLWQRPIIIPLPESTVDVRQPVISLNGAWMMAAKPNEKFWEKGDVQSGWQEVNVPGQLYKQNIYVERGKEYAYKKEVFIPQDYKGKRIFLYFEGVSGTARIWVNGIFLKQHHGGFNVWTCDITDQVNPGETSVLTLGIVDDTYDKTTSGFDFGGILRNVKLMAVSQDHIMRFHVETDLDEEYKNATLKVWLGMAFNNKSKSKISLTLKDPSGKIVPIAKDEFYLTADNPENICAISINNPIKWDAEHPNLYTLSASIINGKNVTEVLKRKVGFREVAIEGKRVLVNGKEVKLRGAGRFDSDPDFGSYLSDRKSWEEVKLLKDANLNFVRPACYPATNAYLDACDSLGLYVQIENSVTFTRNIQDDTAYTSYFMDQMAEMIETVRSHPGIIIYELANETYYGVNISKTYDYAKAEDPTRPVIYSWSQSIPEGVDWPYDIFSYHYPDWNTDLGSPGVAVFNSQAVRELPTNMPVFHDEFAHGASYYQPSLARDPGMRNFWGESIKVFWERMFETDGCLGGSMWAIIDENGFGSWVYEWGALDLWRRKRPEYWHFRKAYSPIRIKEKTIDNPGNGNPIRLPISNWYDHTNLNELKVGWRIGDEAGEVKGPKIEPHESGYLQLPARNWQSNDKIDLRFTDSYGRLIDQFIIKVSPGKYVFQEPQGPSPKISENENQIIITGTDFEIVFSKKDGLIQSGTYKDQLIIKGGPYFHLTGGKPMGSWKLKSVLTDSDAREAIVIIRGTNDPVDLEFEVRIDGTGLIHTQYVIHEFGIEAPKTSRKIWDDQDEGGFQEVGISYLLSSGIDQLKWDRNGLWSYYPPDHIGRNEGIAMRTSKAPSKLFWKEPERSWSEDEKDFSVFGRYDIGGRGTNDFRSMKEYIHYAVAFDSNKSVGVKVESDGTDAVRLEVQEDIKSILTLNSGDLTFKGRWVDVKDSIQYYGVRERISSTVGDEFSFSFSGTGFAWIGTSDQGLASADIYIDGVLVEENLRFYGRSKSPNSILYSKDELQEGSHSVRIIASKPSNSQMAENNVVIPVGAIKILNKKINDQVKIIINSQWNYTKLGLGNYMKPQVHVKKGDKGNVAFRLIENLID